MNFIFAFFGLVWTHSSLTTVNSYFIHLTDLHLSKWKPISSFARLEAFCGDVLAKLLTDDLEFIAITGDITDGNGNPYREGFVKPRQQKEEWEAYSRIIRKCTKHVPVFDTRGNHDCFAVSRYKSSDNLYYFHSATMNLNKGIQIIYADNAGATYAFTMSGVQYVFLDGCPEPGTSRSFYGMLADSAVGFLESRLETGQKTVVFTHYPLGTYDTFTRSKLVPVIGKYSGSIQMILCGHLHQVFTRNARVDWWDSVPEFLTLDMKTGGAYRVVSVDSKSSKRNIALSYGFLDLSEQDNGIVNPIWPMVHRTWEEVRVFGNGEGRSQYNLSEIDSASLSFVIPDELYPCQLSIISRWMLMHFEETLWVIALCCQLTIALLITWFDDLRSYVLHSKLCFACPVLVWLFVWGFDGELCIGGIWGFLSLESFTYRPSDKWTIILVALQLKILCLAFGRWSIRMFLRSERFRNRLCRSLILAVGVIIVLSAQAFQANWTMIAYGAIGLFSPVILPWDIYWWIKVISLERRKASAMKCEAQNKKYSRNAGVRSTEGVPVAYFNRNRPHSVRNRFAVDVAHY